MASRFSVNKLRWCTTLMALLLSVPLSLIGIPLWQAVPAQAQALPYLTLPFPPDARMAIQQGYIYTYWRSDVICSDDREAASRVDVHRLHCGIDYIKGTVSDSNSNDWATFPVWAAADGTAYLNWSADGGNAVIIEHSGGLETYYGHLDHATVSSGASVHRGQLIGWAGNSGPAGTPLHLHFQVKLNTILVDPYKRGQDRNAYPDPNGTNGLRSGLGSLWSTNPPTYYNPSSCIGEGVYLYEHINYAGHCQKFNADSPDWPEWFVGNDSVSSVRIVGNWTATLYENSRYGGRYTTITSNQPDMRNDNAIGNDAASSIRVQRGVSNSGTGRWAVRIYNMDDWGAAWLNNSQIASASYGQSTGWVNITDSMVPGDNELLFADWNESNGYTWGFQISYNGTVVWSDQEGQQGVFGADNNNTSRNSQYVHMADLTLHPDGTVTQ